MNWNYRILAHLEGDEVYLQVHEVYYNKIGTPIGYNETPKSIGGLDVNEINWEICDIQKSVKKPILWADNRFPEVCTIKYSCDLCGRNNFDSPSPHKCNGGFRKRGLKWTKKYS